MVKVIGLIGSIGAGKGEAGKYLVSKYGYVQITVGDVVREECKNRGLEITRDNCDNISKEMIAKNGEDHWMQQVVNKIKNENISKAIVDGVRSPRNNELLVESFGKDYILIKIDANPEIRFERLKSRGRPGFPKTLEEFAKHEKRQNQQFNLDETFNQVNEVVDNSTTLEDLYNRIDKLKEKYSDWF